MAGTDERGNGEAYKRGMPLSANMANDPLINLYLNALRAQKKSPNTIRRYTWLLGKLSEFLYPTTILAATHHELLAWQSTIAHLEPGTVAGYVAAIRTFYRWTVRPMHILDISPAEELVGPHVPAYLPRPIPEDEFQQALVCSGDEMLATWLCLGRYVGLRCCEIAWMQRDWVVDDAKKPRLHVTGKGNRNRRIPVDTEIVDVLRPWMRRQGHLFTYDDGRPFKPNNVSDRINRHLRVLGITATAHQLRHLYGTDALHRTKNLRLVQEMMGHSSPATTQVYTEVDEGEALELARDLGADLRKTNRRRR